MESRSSPTCHDGSAEPLALAWAAFRGRAKARCQSEPSFAPSGRTLPGSRTSRRAYDPPASSSRKAGRGRVLGLPALPVAESRRHRPLLPLPAEVRLQTKAHCGAKPKLGSARPDVHAHRAAECGAVAALPRPAHRPGSTDANRRLDRRLTRVPPSFEAAPPHRRNTQAHLLGPGAPPVGLRFGARLRHRRDAFART